MEEGWIRRGVWDTLTGTANFLMSYKQQLVHKSLLSEQHLGTEIATAPPASRQLYLTDSAIQAV